MNSLTRLRRDLPGRHRGITLLELMIALAVVAILMSVAYPSYLEQARKGRRADAQAVLMEAAHFMERYATENQRYDKNLAAVAVALPTALRKSPKGSANATYNISLLSVSQESYTLRAVPTGAQASDVCGTLTINQAGEKSGAKSDCWRK
jgi:type IV pilus assembly protein PilE